MEGYIGQVILFAGNFAPRGWAFCQGQLLSIAQNTALFSILGTTYGGNGQTTFGLPDLRGRVPVGTGTGPGLSAWDLGQMEGAENVSLGVNQMPAHNHSVMVSSGAANSATGKGNYLASPNGTFAGDPVKVNAYNGTPTDLLGTSTITNSGSGAPHSNIQPSLGLNYIICMEGIFPSRN
ncbi:phage tail protein [Longitalea luteola]|uniref:phage tail protein n=1 Tax=Longitalea luteola TaxID=2812563 RepID=UPI001A968233|nr:tail fiber protein [Longitalea luteola]